MHELVHQIIFKTYGIDSYIRMGALIAWTIPYDMELAMVRCNETCQLAHNINEAIGYQLQYFWVMVFCAFQILIMMREKKAVQDEIKELEQNSPALIKQTRKHKT